MKDRRRRKKQKFQEASWENGVEDSSASFSNPRKGSLFPRRSWFVEILNRQLAADTTLMAESEEELKSFLMKMKEGVKSWLKTQHSEN